MPEPVDLIALGKKPMSTDVEPISFVAVGPADTTNQPRVRLEDDTGLAVLAELVRGSETGWSPACDDRLVRRHDRDRFRIIDTGPTMGNQSGTYPLRLWLLPIHDRLLIP